MTFKVHFEGRYLRLVEVDDWEYVTRSNASGVAVLVPLTDLKEVVLVEQFRPPVGQRVIELPAGLIGDQSELGESPLVAASRELEEETGFSAGTLKLLMVCPSSAGMTDERLFFVLATDLTRTGPGGGDAGEDIEVHIVPCSKIDGWLERNASSGKLVDPKIYSALYWLQKLGLV